MNDAWKCSRLANYFILDKCVRKSAVFKAIYITHSSANNVAFQLFVNIVMYAIERKFFMGYSFTFIPCGLDTHFKSLGESCISSSGGVILYFDILAEFNLLAASPRVCVNGYRKLLGAVGMRAMGFETWSDCLLYLRRCL